METFGKGVKIDPIPDPRADAILADPEGYFEDARTRVRAEVEAEMAQEEERRVTALDTAARHEVNGRIVFSVPAIIRGFKAKRR